MCPTVRKSAGCRISFLCTYGKDESMATGLYDMKGLQDQFRRFVLAAGMADDFPIVEIEEDAQIMPLFPYLDDCSVWVVCFECPF